MRPPSFSKTWPDLAQNGPFSWEVSWEFLFDFRARRHCRPLDKWLAGWLRVPQRLSHSCRRGETQAGERPAARWMLRPKWRGAPHWRRRDRRACASPCRAPTPSSSTKDRATSPRLRPLPPCRRPPSSPAEFLPRACLDRDRSSRTAIGGVDILAVDVKLIGLHGFPPVDAFHGPQPRGRNCCCRKSTANNGLPPIAVRFPPP